MGFGWIQEAVAGFPGGSAVENLPAMQDMGVPSLGQKIPWRRKWQPTPVFLPGASQGQRRLAGHSPRGHTVHGVTQSTGSQRQDVAAKQQNQCPPRGLLPPAPSALRACASPGPPWRPASCPGLDTPGVPTLCSRQSRARPCSSRACLPFSCGLSSQAHVCLSLHEGSDRHRSELSPGDRDAAGQMCTGYQPAQLGARGGGPTPSSAMTRVPSPEEPCFHVYTRHRRVSVCLCPSLRKVSANPNEA